MIALLVGCAAGFVVGAVTAYKLSGVAGPLPATPDVVSMARWQAGMDAWRRADGRAFYMWDLFRVPEEER